MRRTGVAALVACGAGMALYLLLWRPILGDLQSASPAWAASKQDRSGRFQRERAQVRKAQRLVKRISRDRRTPPALKAKAEDLGRLLAEREGYLTELEARRREFLNTHRPEIEELARLRARTREIKDSLAEARARVLDDSKGEVEAFLATSERARKLADSLHQAYQELRHQRRRR